MGYPKYAVEISGLSFMYDEGPVLHEVNLVIPEGDFSTIIGPNGSGKTTLVKLVLGELRPARGHILVFSEPPGKRLSLIGYMSQHMNYDTRFPVNVMDVTLMGRLHHRHLFGWYGSEDRDAALKALEDVDMADFRAHPFSSLSGGQRQRVLIARSLATEPKLLLLDEPTSSVDIAAEKEFYDLLKKLNERMTIVVVSHDIGFVSTYVKNVICVNNRNVRVHPSAGLGDREIADIYGMEMQLVRHDHSDEGFPHE